MKNMTWIKESNIAHRGLHNKIYPENSLEAFQQAAKRGFNIELDLQLTKDNVIIIFHDDNLKRLCGINKLVADTNYDFLEGLALKKSNAKIPTFQEVLESIPVYTHLMIELKTSKKNKLLVDLFLKAIKNYTFTYVVQSFDPRIVRLLRKKAPEITRGLIMRTSKLSKLGSFFPVHTLCKPDYYVYKFEHLPNKKMDKYLERGYPILSYTARSQKNLNYIRKRYTNAVFEGFIPKQ